MYGNNGAIANTGEGIYIPSPTTYIHDYCTWLASPISSNDGYDTKVSIVTPQGDLFLSSWANGYGYAPLVSLKAGVDLTTLTTSDE